MMLSQYIIESSAEAKVNVQLKVLLYSTYTVYKRKTYIIYKLKLRKLDQASLV